MTALTLLNEFRSNQEELEYCPDEAAWHNAWDRLITTGLSTPEPSASGLSTSRLPPSLIALKGGLYSSTPTQIFISGYQAAVHSIFPEIPKTGWTAFAASEDQTDPVAHPPMRLVTEDNNVKLIGTKSWIAQSRHVDHLVITAISETNKTIAAIVNRHQPGIIMTHRESPRFLPAMSQGFAKLDNIPVDNSMLLETDRRKQFVKSESKFIMLACAAWMFGQTPEGELELSNKLKNLVLHLTECCNNPEHSVVELAIQDDILQKALVTFEQSDSFKQYKNWKTDRQIFTIYSEGIQNRAAKKSA